MSVQTRERALGARVRELRLERKLRQTDLALKAGISWRHLLRIEKGEGGVAKAATLMRIAEALGVPVKDLTGDEDDEDDSDPMAALMSAIRRLVREEADALRLPVPAPEVEA